ncbi:hypothetical protein [Enhygromyxa salina]|uniref:hypothetical protein n=1 Tax=Enhygromyxa salina TaxID=215803 RepID=UPI0013FCFC15|nr:hypothetical protein [Enhygromyxa salina]
MSRHPIVASACSLNRRPLDSEHDSVVKTGVWLKTQQESKGNTRAKGRVDVVVTDVHYTFTVHVWTRVKGHLQTGHGTATYIMFGENNTVISTLRASEYASTDLFATSDEDHNHKQKRILKSYFDESVVAELLVVNARQVSWAPTDWPDTLKWLFQAGGQILIDYLLDSYGAGPGVHSGPNFILRVLK